MATYALTMVAGPAWQAGTSRREQPGWAEHAAFMDRLVDEGFVVLGGPLGAGDRVLLVVEAGSEQEVRRRLAQDPWAAGERLAIGDLQAWWLWLDGRRPPGAGDPQTPDGTSRSTTSGR